MLTQIEREAKYERCLELTKTNPDKALTIALELLNDQHERLCELHDAGTAALKRMASHLATLKAAASARDLNRETESALRDLRSSVARVCRVADESSHYLTEHVDELEARMQTLDAEAASRQEAHAEVEAALDRVRRWQ